MGNLAVILASGYGTRLASYLDNKPKFLLEIHGKPIFTYPLNALIKIGIKKYIFVLPGGWKKAFNKYINTKYKDVEFIVIENKYVSRGNGFSFLLSKGVVDRDYFILSMVDHIYSIAIPLKIKSRFKHKPDIIAYMGVDSNPKYIDLNEATKVKVDRNNNVVKIGKNMEEYNYVDIGIFIIANNLYRVAEKLEAEKYEFSFTDILNKAVEMGYVIKPVNINPLVWTEIDTPHDLKELYSGKRRPVLNQVIEELQTV